MIIIENFLNPEALNIAEHIKNNFYKLENKRLGWTDATWNPYLLVLSALTFVILILEIDEYLLFLFEKAYPFQGAKIDSQFCVWVKVLCIVSQ